MGKLQTSACTERTTLQSKRRIAWLKTWPTQNNCIRRRHSESIPAYHLMFRCPSIAIPLGKRSIHKYTIRSTLRTCQYLTTNKCVVCPAIERTMWAQHLPTHRWPQWWWSLNWHRAIFQKRSKLARYTGALQTLRWIAWMQMPWWPIKMVLATVFVSCLWICWEVLVPDVYTLYWISCNRRMPMTFHWFVATAWIPWKYSRWIPIREESATTFERRRCVFLTAAKWVFQEWKVPSNWIERVWQHMWRRPDATKKMSQASKSGTCRSWLKYQKHPSVHHESMVHCRGNEMNFRAVNLKSMGKLFAHKFSPNLADVRNWIGKSDSDAKQSEPNNDHRLGCSQW